MSKMSQTVNQLNKKDNTVINYMGGKNYKLNPLETLKMVSASSIFGEPSYYRNGEFADKTIKMDIKSFKIDDKYKIHELVKNYTLLSKEYEGLKTSDIMEKIIDDALDYDFEGVLEWAQELRGKRYNMRLNPQIIMVRAAVHKNRIKFNKVNPGKFRKINSEVMARLDEPAVQLTYWLYKNKTKNNIPNILKKTWADKYVNASRYHMAKYKNAEIGMLDTIRICHPDGKKNECINELIKTETIQVSDDQITWEKYIAEHGSSKDTWEWVVDNIFAIENNGKIIAKNHMALLRNLRNILNNNVSNKHIDKTCIALKLGVESGKQFPFRYYTAKNVINQLGTKNGVSKVLDSLEECMDIAIKNMPTLKGRTMCLSDNSGSAWGSFNSEYGSVTVADIANLSSVITAKNSEEGYVGAFGDELTIQAISKRDGILSQHEKITSLGKDVGRATENGIWLFFDKIIKEKEHWDNIFIYSDQQAGTGGLYGTERSLSVYGKEFGYSGRYINIIKLINKYRKEVNPNVNIYTIQVAGYDNVVVPANLYRTSILYGWTGREVEYADIINKQWDEIDNKKNQ